jgi:hypothetical protein
MGKEALISIISRIKMGSTKFIRSIKMVLYGGEYFFVDLNRLSNPGSTWSGG